MDKLPLCPFCGYQAKLVGKRDLVTCADPDMECPIAGVEMRKEEWRHRSAPAQSAAQDGLVSITDYETDEQACAAGVSRFAAAMLAKLDRKRKEGRGGWNKPSECSIDHLQELMDEHLADDDLVDIANFCMMIWNRENPNAVPSTNAAQQENTPYVSGSLGTDKAPACAAPDVEKVIEELESRAANVRQFSNDMHEDMAEEFSELDKAICELRAALKGEKR